MRGLVLLLLAAAVGSGPLAAQTTFTVTTTADEGPGSLRQALLDANANTGADLIAFAIPGDGPHTIQPQSALPRIEDPVTIDGLTQPGADCTTWPATLRIELDGTDGSGPGLSVFTSDVVLRGLVVNRSQAAGIRISGFVSGGDPVPTDNTVIECMYVGTDVSGTVALGSRRDGIEVSNAIGTRIGGTLPGQRNLISGNGNEGIDLSGTRSSSVLGNYIGTDVTGQAVLPNEESGITIRSGAAGTPTATDNTIGGTDHDPWTCNRACNLISGNEEEGVDLFGPDDNPPTGTVILGNFIGTDAAGLAALPNGEDVSDEGLSIFNALDTQVGGSEPEAGNLIAGNAGLGLDITGISSGTRVQGNRIGTDANGVGALGNGGQGVVVQGIGNEIGGSGASAGNVIAFNALEGILVTDGDANPLRRNAVFSNGGIGIDLGRDGATPNDAGDGDSGPNNLQNFPTLASASGDGAATLTVRYTIDTAPANAAYPLTIEFFLADADGEEGQVFLGTDTYAESDAQAEREVAFNPAQVVPTSARLLATATDADGNTSEFSASVAVSGSVASEGDTAVPTALALDLAGPNPFRRATTLALTMPEAGSAEVAVYDVLGRQVALLHDGTLTAGSHTFDIRAGRWSPGLYVVRAETGRATATRQVTVLR